MTAPSHQTSAGHVLSNAGWLESHFAACRAEYTAMLDSARFPRGATLLDAGCGNGLFLPLLARIAGARGRVIALDLAPEHLRGIGGSGEMDAVVGSVSALPLRAGAVDGAWCANVTQLFSDEELPALLNELGRVTAPGGTVAVKDSDMTGWRVEPAPPFLGLHLAEAAASGEDATQSLGSIRGRRLRRLLEAAGFENVQQRSVLIERWAPLDDATASFWAEWLTYLAGVASQCALPAKDAEFWDSMSAAGGARGFVAGPDFYGCELQVVASGEAPR